MLILGKEGEHLAREIWFDLSRWKETFGPGEAQLLARRSGEELHYPVAITEEDNWVIWSVNGADVAKAGLGSCKLRYCCGEAVVKSETWLTFVLDGVEDVTPPPGQPEAEWLEQMLNSGVLAQRACEDARAAQQAIEDMTVSVEMLGEESTAAVQKSVKDGVVHLHYQIPRGETGAPGRQGETGAAGKDGYTPVCGVDYWTEADREELRGASADLIAAELAKRGQLKPEFANSVAELEEKGDPTKLYVLPDGFIYAYMQSGESASNQIKRSIDTEGNLYNGGKGWKTGYRLNSSGSEAAFSGWEVTGFIPVDANSYAYFSDIDWNSDGQGRDYLALYDSSFNLIGSQTIISSWLTNNAAEYVGSDAILDENNNLTYLKFSCLVSGGFAGADKSLLQNMAYFRISACGITDESNIAVNELISESGSEYEWGSTGHAFVPADYEDRIFAAEQAVDGHEARIQSLENGVDVGVPDYVVEEAEAVISRVIAAQGGRTFTFAAITDLHYGNNGNQTGVERAVKAMKYIDKRIKLDAVAVLGDYTDGYPADGLDNAIGDFKAVSNVLDEMRFAPNLRLQGNHDYYADNFPATHRFIQAFSDDVVWGSKLGGYFYRDFADFKLRVICVNTTEEGNDYVRCSAAQYGWFASALDLTDKDDVSQWQILVLSHHPLDWYVAGDYVFCHILDAYKNGTSGTAGGVTFDYTGGLNAAKLIGNIHGHIHNLLTDYIHLGNVSGGNKSTVLRMSTPEACVGRENQYEGVWAEDTGYPKTANTAEETSFCVYCIDLDECTIKAICYGAGYDREVSYQYTNDVKPPEKPVPVASVNGIEPDENGNVQMDVAVNYDLNVKAVNHRGFSTEAPENTIPAYILSKKKGFTYVECDVSFTKDGVAVLLHDGTVNRTSDGSGNISDLDYVEVFQYDFGSWKDAKYAGTKIPTFKEFIVLCRNLGLHPYIELKSNGAYTREQVHSLVDMVEEYGMKGKVTWISFSATFLAYIRDYDKTARLGYVCSLSSAAISVARNLRTGENDVFLDCSYSSVTDVSACVEADIPLEVWTVDSEETIKGLDPYISGVTSNSLIAGKILHDASLAYVAADTPDLSAIAISLDAAELSFTSKEYQEINATVLPVACTDPVVWTSSDENVVTVSEGMATTHAIVTPVRSGTATIKATAGSMSAECAVTVDVDDRTLLYNWDFTNSMTDTVSSLTPTLQNNATQDTKGLSIPAANSYANFGAIAKRGMTFELDITADSNLNTGTAHGRLLCFSKNNSSLDDGVLWRGSTYNYWGTYLSSGWGKGQLSTDPNVFSGKTMTVVINTDGTVDVYAGNELLVKTNDVVDFESGGYVTLGSSSIAAIGVTITAMRIYDGTIVIPQTKPDDWVDDVIVLKPADFVAKGIAFSSETGADYPYLMSRTDRVSFTGYNVTLDPGYEYTVTVESGTGAIGKLAVRQIPSWYDVKAKVHLTTSHDSGWQNNGYKFAQQNGYECAWVTLAAANTSDAVSLADLTSVTITRSKG